MLLVIRRLLSSLLIVDMPSTPKDFSFNFRRSGLRGRLRPPCRYGDKKHITPGQVYPVKVWYAIDANEEPLMPTNLSKRGANRHSSRPPCRKRTTTIPRKPARQGTLGEGCWGEQ